MVNRRKRRKKKEVQATLGTIVPEAELERLASEQAAKMALKATESRDLKSELPDVAFDNPINILSNPDGELSPPRQVGASMALRRRTSNPGGEAVHSNPLANVAE